MKNSHDIDEIGRDEIVYTFEIGPAPKPSFSEGGTISGMTPGDSSATFSLPDGRRLGYATWGAPHGVPVVYLSGTPCSRYEGLIFADAGARKAGVKLICPERPGSGLSDFKPEFTFRDVADDVAALADHLNLGRFPVMGLSGGGPYAQALGYFLGHRVTSVHLVAGLGPLDLPELTDGRIPRSRVFRLFRLMGRAPWLARWTYRVMTALGKLSPAVALRLLTQQVPPADRAVLKHPGVWEKMARYMLTEPFLHGVRGPAYEATLYAKPWGFRMEGIRVPVHLWHGDRDAQCPIEMAHFIAARIPGARLHVIPDGGHLFIVSHGEPIFQALANEPQEARP